MSVGPWPHSSQSVWQSFHRVPVFSMREQAVSNSVSERAIGCESSDERVIAQNLFSTSAARWRLTAVGFHVTNEGLGAIGVDGDETSRSWRFVVR